jgi:deoxyribodipyrimidine photo-lyase
LLATGTIHNYPRMLWAKRLLDWTASAEEAWALAVWLNDWLALDGRDPNGYANIAWCRGGKHDRPWPERPIFGQVRYMTTARAGAHFSVAGYLARVNARCAAAGIPPIA